MRFCQFYGQSLLQDLADSSVVPVAAVYNEGVEHPTKTYQNDTPTTNKQSTKHIIVVELADSPCPFSEKEEEEERSR
jgi:hypothetical protein